MGFLDFEILRAKVRARLAKVRARFAKGRARLAKVRARLAKVRTRLAKVRVRLAKVRARQLVAIMTKCFPDSHRPQINFFGFFLRATFS